MPCPQSAADTRSSAQLRLDEVFNRFWPPTAPFPPMAPYIAAVVNRRQARAWASAIGAEQDVAVLAADPQAVLDLVGRAMMDPGAVFKSARLFGKKKKPKYTDKSICRCTSYQNGQAYTAETECSAGQHCCCDGQGPDVRAFCSSSPCPDWGAGGPDLALNPAQVQGG